MENTAVQYLTSYERDLMTHISRFGASGYPVIRVGKSWSWSFRDDIASAKSFPTKKAAIASFEAYHQSLIDQYALENIDSGFREWLKAVGEANERTVFQVFVLWRKYCKDCQNFDQSPVKFEFLQWNQLKEAA